MTTVVQRQNEQDLQNPSLVILRKTLLQTIVRTHGWLRVSHMLHGKSAQHHESRVIPKAKTYYPLFQFAAKDQKICASQNNESADT